MSEWQERAIRRRDERHTKIESIRAPARPKKDRKKWCKGRVGVEHAGKWVKPRGGIGAYSLKDMLVYQCQKCKKHLDIWWGFTAHKKRYHKPKEGSTQPLQEKEKTLYDRIDEQYSTS